MKHHKEPEKSYTYDDRDKLPKDEDFLTEEEGDEYEARGGFFELEVMNIKVSRDIKYDYSPFKGAVKESWIRSQMEEHAGVEDTGGLIKNEVDLGGDNKSLIIYSLSGNPPKGYAVLKDVEDGRNQLWFYNEEFYPYLLVESVDRVIMDITEDE